MRSRYCLIQKYRRVSEDPYIRFLYLYTFSIKNPGKTVVTNCFYLFSQRRSSRGEEGRVVSGTDPTPRVKVPVSTSVEVKSVDQPLSPLYPYGVGRKLFPRVFAGILRPVMNQYPDVHQRYLWLSQRK